MYVCLCHGVTDSVLREAVREGVSTLRELSYRTGCGTRCGRCATLARSLLQQNLASFETPTGPVELRVVKAA